MKPSPSFQAMRWLSNPHLQTVYPALMRRSKPLVRRRERLMTWDGDFIDLDWYGNDAQRLAILLHGLAGSSNSGYILGLQAYLQDLGWSSVAMNFRGCSGEPNRRAHCYHSGETEDIQFVYQTLRQRLPDSQFAAVGFSLGGNVLLKWLGEQGNQVTLSGAVAVSVPLVLSECANRLDQGFSRIYRQYLLNGLKQYMRSKLRTLQHLQLHEEAERIQQLGDMRAIHSFWQYDHQIVAPLHGFASASDYYQRASSRQFLKRIKVPTLIVQAEDDPFMTPAVLPSPNELAPCVQLELSKHGGHVGFVGGRGVKPDYWLEQRIGHFLTCGN